MKKVPLSIAKPELAKQLHPHKNPGITVETISYQDKREVWWLCGKGHEWKEKVSSRSRQKTSDCKICISLVCTHPDLVQEMHPTLNGDIKAESLTAGSHLKIWWICKKGHEYDAVVKNRANGSGCPYCSGKKTLPEKSVSITHPELVKFLHPTKNKGFSPEKVTANYLKPVWWLCDKGHEWQETIQNCSRQSELICPTCRSVGYLKPSLLEEWHPDNKLSPYETPANYNEKVKWRCKACSHEWLTSVANRFRGSGCPGCSGAAVTHKTSVAAICPEIAKEWDYIANSKTPNDYTIGSTEEVQWICENGHRYKESIYDRTTRNRGCPTCKTIAYLCPHLLDEWSPENTLSPHEEFAGSGKEVIWKCRSCSHVWIAKIVGRYHGQGCPNCNSGWTIDNIRRFVSSILPYLDTLSPAGRYVLFRQKGLLSMAKEAKGHSFVQALKTGRFPKEELEKFVDGQPSLVDEFIANPNFSLEEQEISQEDPEKTLSENDILNFEKELPIIETKDILASLDSKLFSSLDREAVDFFIKEAVARIWQCAFLDEGKAIKQLEQYRDEGMYAQEVKRLFLHEYQGAKSLQIPDGYTFPAQLNLMQYYTAYLLKSRKRIGNWSGTGAGKTWSAILASGVISAKLTVICCPNNVVDNWKVNILGDRKRNIKGIHPESSVFIKNTDAKKDASKKPKYLILNYEFFQQPKAEQELKTLIENNIIDLIIIDEIHYSKQRELEKISLRKAAISAFLSEAATKNANLHVLGMSATPVINNLFEGKTLIEMVTGVHHDELNTQPTIPNCIAHYQKFVSHGIRWIPQYSYRLNIQTERIDCSVFLPEIKQQSVYGSMVDLEAVLTKAKLPFILASLKPKTIVYTHYIKGILPVLQEAIESKGWRVTVFTGENKDGLDAFIDGNADVLIASSCVGTGVDRLQYVCNRLIVNSLPWTHAEFEQLKGRIYRQGQVKDHVDVLVPLTYAEVNGEEWSWCDSRWRRIQFKKSISDAAVDGIIPEGHLRTPGQAYKDTMLWLERLDRGEVYEIERRKISIPLVGEIKSNVQRRMGDLSQMNVRINQSSSGKTHKRFLDHPEEWECYHSVYREDRKSWPVVPYEEAVKWFKARPHMVIGDFGCGEALLAANVENKVFSFDHVAINENVTACDMCHTSLDDACLDAVVFSLSLMGSNFIDYLKEAHRCLKLDGHLWIAEPTSRIQNIELFRDLLFRLGFDVSRVDEKWKFTFIKAIKSEREINLTHLESNKNNLLS